VVEGVAVEKEQLLEKIRSALAEYIQDISEGKGLIEVLVPVESIVEAARRFKELGFDHVKSLTVVDYKKEGKIRVMYHASSYSDFELSKYIVGIGYEIPRDRDRVPSLIGVWTSVDFQEREVYEGFGITFEGHPDMRPILLAPPVAELKPLSKDFVVKEENIFKK